MSESLPLSADERRHYEELKAIDALSSAALRSVSAEYQELLKFLRAQKPVGEITSFGHDWNRHDAKVPEAKDIPIGTKLYTNQFALDYLDLLEFWRGVRDVKRILRDVRIPEAEAVMVQLQVRFQDLLARHNIDVPPDQY